MAKSVILTGTVLNVDGNFEKTMRKFKKKIADSGLLDELRDRMEYTKPTVKRKLKAAAARARNKRRLKQEQLPEKLY
jgi:small subunit ribosomal protein S21